LTKRTSVGGGWACDAPASRSRHGGHCFSFPSGGNEFGAHRTNWGWRDNQHDYDSCEKCTKVAYCYTNLLECKNYSEKDKSADKIFYIAKLNEENDTITGTWGVKKQRLEKSDFTFEFKRGEVV
jgi:hypothetical protein